MFRNTDRIRFLFCGTTAPAEKGFGSKLREATQASALLSMFLMIPPMIYFYFFFDVKEYIAGYVAYSFLEFTGPLLLIAGASFYQFTPAYIGLIVYSVFTFLELTVKLAFGFFVAFYYLSPNDDRRETFLIVYLVTWCVWIALRLYINYVFFSFVKRLGMALEFADKGEFLNRDEPIITTRIIREEKHIIEQDDNNQYNQVIVIPPSDRN
jgi:hypothetical protein